MTGCARNSDGLPSVLSSVALAKEECLAKEGGSGRIAAAEVLTAAESRAAPYTHLEPRIYETGAGERRRRGIPVEPNAPRASSSVQERHLPRLANQEIHTNRICRPDGALDCIGRQFYIDAAPTALEERVLC